MSKKIEYISPEGYRGVLYGKSSMSIYGPDGKEVLHTGFRTPNTYEELKEAVDGYPEFNAILLSGVRHENIGDGGERNE